MKRLPREGVRTADQVIRQIVVWTRIMPELKGALPRGADTAAFWRKTFGRNDRTRRLLEMLREAPAFNEQAPADRKDAAAWRKVLDLGLGNQAVALLINILHIAKQNPVPPRKIRRWRDRFGAGEVIQRVRPEESTDLIPNPHRGTTTFQRFQGDPPYPLYFTSDTHGPAAFEPGAPVRDNPRFVPQTTLSYCRWPWAWLEPHRREYRWDLVDESLKTARRRGQTLQVRFQPYTLGVDYAAAPPTSERHPPERTVNMPPWYWDTGAGWIDRGPYARNEPDSNDPRYLEHFGEFIRAFAARYDGHEDLESIDMSYAGFWGESGGNSTPETAARLTDVYLESFQRTQLLSMLGTPGCEHAAAVAADRNPAIGWRADCFGDLRKVFTPDVPPELVYNHTNDDYPRMMEVVRDAWKRAPVTGETCGNVAWWFMAGYDFDRIVHEGVRWHMSVFMPKSVFYPRAIYDKMIEFDKRLGYRYVLRQMRLPLEAKAGARVPMNFYIDNVGCAPIYRPYPLAIRFRQRGRAHVVRLKEDIRTWMPGNHWFEESVEVPAALEAGEAQVDVGILDPKSDRPKVRLAIRERLDDGWHPMSSMDICK